MKKNKVERLLTSFHVAPRFEKYFLPGAVAPCNKIAGYDVVECYDGVEVRRHEFQTQIEAEHFAKQEREFYYEYVLRRGVRPRWIPATVLATGFVAVIIIVRLLLHLIGI